MENKYEIQWRVEALPQIALRSNSEAHSFRVHGVRFSHWEKGIFRGSNFWIAKGCVAAPSLKAAIVEFYAKLKKIIPRISLISQCYIEFPFQPFLVKRTDKESAYFRYVRDSEPIGLLFGDQEKKALKILCKEDEVPEEFYFYWNDSVKTIGYSSKLLIMFSAIDALVNAGRSGFNGKSKREKRIKLLGPELTNEIFGFPGNTQEGLRNRLVHGEYFIRDDGEKDYVDLVHKRIIQYFNETILKEGLLAEDVVAPQRHIWGEKEGDEICGGRFIKAKGKKTFDLKEVLSEADNNDSGGLESYEYIYDGAIPNDY